MIDEIMEPPAGVALLDQATLVPSAAPKARPGLLNWEGLQPLDIDGPGPHANRLMTARSDDLVRKSFDEMATNVLRASEQYGWSSICITSPTPGCGKTMVCANLALTLAQRPNCRVAVL